MADEVGGSPVFPNNSRTYDYFGILLATLYFITQMANLSIMRQVETLSNQHWTIVYLSETPKWHGEGVIVETDGLHSTALIPNIGLETHLHCQRSLPLNTRVPIVLGGSNVPELRASFRIDD